ncbi:hypothetical protein H8356DRAFT_1328976 [Neocallimastix lanati (nom. inval.)]|nr:hypothetical protein H8356DRAFT_1328976 [Neocallimastix sp. JGI-2020a]
MGLFKGLLLREIPTEKSTTLNGEIPIPSEETTTLNREIPSEKTTTTITKATDTNEEEYEEKKRKKKKMKQSLLIEILIEPAVDIQMQVLDQRIMMIIQKSTAKNTTETEFNTTADFIKKNYKIKQFKKGNRRFHICNGLFKERVCHYIKFGVILNVSCINIDSEQYNVDLRDIQNIYLIVECLLYIYYFILWSGVDQYLACLYFLTSCFQRNSAGSNYFRNTRVSETV